MSRTNMYGIRIVQIAIAWTMIITRSDSFSYHNAARFHAKVRLSKTVLDFLAGRSGLCEVGDRPTACGRKCLSHRKHMFAVLSLALPKSASYDGDAGMETIILSLVHETNDGLRRQQLAQLFDNNVSVSNGTSITSSPQLGQRSSKFVLLFDSCLTKIVEDIQLAAREKAIVRRRNQLEEIPSTSKDKIHEDESSNEDTSSAGKATAGVLALSSEEEQRLWACIDLMVQSKIIVKQMTQNKQNR